MFLAIALASCGDDDPGGPGHPAPTLDHLSPDTIAAGSNGATLSLSGDGFIEGSVVRWNGAAKGTSFGSRQQLTVTIGASDLVQAGAAEVLVFNPGPGGGVSEPETVWVVGVNPAPIVTDIQPASAPIGQAFQLEVRGTGFVPASVIHWVGEPRATTFVSDTKLTAEIAAADMTLPGSYPVSVSTPPPGGGASAPFTLTAVPATPELLRVLYIGNSLTYTNNLPGMADSLAAASGLRIQSHMIASPSYALIDHWEIPDRRRQVEEGHYDVVIMQQGPSSLPESRVLLREGVQKWAPLIRAAGGRPAMYAVWPEKARSHVFADVSASYRIAAEDVDGLFFPVGDTWLETWSRMPTAPLYGPDNFHPSMAGTYAAAVVIVSILGNRHPESLAPRFTLPPGAGAEPDSALAATIRAAAAAVIGRLGG